MGNGPKKLNGNAHTIMLESWFSPIECYGVLTGMGVIKGG